MHAAVTTRNMGLRNVANAGATMKGAIMENIQVDTKGKAFGLSGRVAGAASITLTFVNITPGAVRHYLSKQLPIAAAAMCRKDKDMVAKIRDANWTVDVVEMMETEGGSGVAPTTRMKETIDRQRAEIEALEARLAALEARPNTVRNAERKGK